MNYSPKKRKDKEFKLYPKPEVEESKLMIFKEKIQARRMQMKFNKLHIEQIN
jgi:hypothetical protein